jgi:PAS domain-containing protein
MYAVPDITELVKLESEQENDWCTLSKRGKLRLILENISEGIIVANADKKIILANYIANEMLGRAMKCLIIWRIILNFIFHENYFPSQNLPMERALSN